MLLCRGHRPKNDSSLQYCCGIQRIAVGADHGLLVDGHDLAVVMELAEAAIFDVAGKVHVALGPVKIVGGDRHQAACRRLGTEERGVLILFIRWLRLPNRQAGRNQQEDGDRGSLLHGEECSSKRPKNLSLLA